MQKENSSKNIVAIVLARGGSKGIPGKNMMPFCGKPLLQWTLEQLKEVPELNSVWVSSDGQNILDLAKQCECEPIIRPDQLSGDEATSESGWLHALSIIQDQVGEVDLVVAAQATSPIRDSLDFSRALEMFRVGGYDSMFSASFAKDICLWSVSDKSIKCDSYDRTNPNRRRQTTFGERWIENGSFYLFQPKVLLETGTRFGNRIGIFPMAFWKMFEIDEVEDVAMCEVIMQAHLAGRL